MTIEPGDLSGADFPAFPKQLLLTRETPRIRGGHAASFAGWTFTAAPHVPLCPILAGGRQVGLLAGWPVTGGRLVTTSEPIELGEGGSPADLRPCAGRFAILMEGEAGPELRLDAAGLMAMVFDRATGVAGSTPAILSTVRPLERDKAAWAIFDFPKRKGFLPFGLTPWQGIERLLPNHALSLSDFSVRRLWPGPGASFEDRIADPAAAMADLGRHVSATVAAIVAAGSAVLNLSGGCDSRMVLAAARAVAGGLRAETFEARDRVDAFLAARVAARAGVPHRVVARVPPTEADIAGWLDRTGWCLYEAVTHHVATVRANDPGFFPLTGTGAEILRASNWAAEDLGRGDLPLDLLLARLRLPPAAPILAAAEAWRAGLPPMRRTSALDVAKIEIIHGCWAAPGVYGHDIVWPSLHPLADGRVFDVALGLPEGYKFANTAFADFVRPLWPELLDVPVNRVTGLDRLRFPGETLRKLMPVSLKRRLKPYR